MTAQNVIETPFSPLAGPATAAPGPRAGIPDDRELLRAAVELTRDLTTARAAIYWPDMLVSAALGYGGVAGAILFTHPRPRSFAPWSACSACIGRCCSSTN
ncbi:hypothetical protein ACFSTD_16095 [Novosphingobium colocasiae]